MESTQTFPIFIELNLEPQKYGVSFDEIVSLYHNIQNSDLSESVRVEGVMCVPPYFEESINIDQIKDHSYKIPELYTKIRELCDLIGNKQLSIGMSSDMLTAIISKSNCLRIGTDIFGVRDYKKK